MIMLAFFSWLPLPFRILVSFIMAVFIIWAITGIIKRIVDCIPGA